MSQHYTANAMQISFFLQIYAICDINTDQIRIMSQIRLLYRAVLSKNNGSVTTIAYSVIDVTSYSYFYDICPVFRPAVSFLFLVCSFISFKTSSCPTNMHPSTRSRGIDARRVLLSRTRSRGTGPAPGPAFQAPGPSCLKTEMLPVLVCIPAFIL